MKKLLYTLSVAAFLLLVGYISISPMINKSGNSLSGDKMVVFPEENDAGSPESTNSSSLLPFNSWDPKMLIW